MKKISYPKAWALNNIIISFDQSNMGFFLDTIFSSLLPEELGNHKDFVLWETGFARGDLAFCSENYRHSFNKISWVFPYPITLSGSRARLEFPSLMLCFCISCPEETHGLQSTMSADISHHSTADFSPAFWAWDRLLTTVGEMLESKLSRDPSFLQSSTCSS